jgi:hypothetical protein
VTVRAVDPHRGGDPWRVSRQQAYPKELAWSVWTTLQDEPTSSMRLSLEKTMSVLPLRRRCTSPSESLWELVEEAYDLTLFA